MKVLIVSGIWPPDVGGPATHAPEVAEHLQARGHDVAVVTNADSEPVPRSYPVHWVPRRIPIGLRHARAADLVRRAARSADVVYSTGMTGRSAVGAATARKPLVLKLTSDPTYERAIRFGLYRGGLDSFQHFRGPRAGALRLARDLELRAATRILIPSASLRDLALGWGLKREKVEVLPNPIATPEDLPPREELRRAHGLEGPRLAFAGRL